MEAFEKWWLQETTKNEKGYCMIAWRAGLKEVLKVAEMYEEDWDHTISDWIKKELGE